VVDAAVELFGSSVARLWIVDDDERHVSLRTEAGTAGRIDLVARLRVGDGLVGTVVATREPLEVLDVLNDPRARFVERVRAEGVVSVVIVPLEVGVRALGALALGTPTPSKRSSSWAPWPRTPRTRSTTPRHSRTSAPAAPTWRRCWRSTRRSAG